jgi:DNA/RNA-binding domain of Phe-tRNA-synthetase-like protein
VPPPLELRIDDAVREVLPGLRILAFRFTGARVGMANRKLEPLRDRVLASVRERVATARDVRRIPTFIAFHQGFPDLARGPRRAWLDEAFHAIARRDPFRVMNDAIDAARLLAFHHGVPVSAHDAARIQGPLSLEIAVGGAVLPTLQGVAVDPAGLPVLRDRGGVLGSPLFEVQRAAASTRTQEILLVVYDPGVEGALDAADLQARAENWFSSLCGARLVETITSPA